jgi:hypothetical protein
MTSCRRRSLAETTKPRDRLAIMKALDVQMEKLTQKLSADNNATIDVSEILRGPKLSKQKSRMTAYASEGEEG